MTVSQINSGTAGEKADAKFGAIITLYRKRFLPNERDLHELKRKLFRLFPAHAALIDAFTVARQDEIDELNGLLKTARTPDDLKTLVERLKFPNAPELEFSTVSVTPICSTTMLSQSSAMFRYAR